MRDCKTESNRLRNIKSIQTDPFEMVVVEFLFIGVSIVDKFLVVLNSSKRKNHVWNGMNGIGFQSLQSHF